RRAGAPPRRDPCAEAGCRSSFLARLGIEPPHLGDALAQPRFAAALGGLVPLDCRHAFGEVVLARRVGALLLVRVAIVLAVAKLLHELRRGVPDVQRYGPGTV